MTYDISTITERSHCTVCDHNVLDFLLETPALPVFQGCVVTPEQTDIQYPQIWASCPQCGTVQLTGLMPLNLVYIAGHAASLGKIWDDHHAALAGFISRHVSGAVVEVGGGVGKLARAYRGINGQAVWYNLEPNPPPEGAMPPVTNFINMHGFFDADFALPENANTLVFSHCLEHIHNLSEMVSMLADKLPSTCRVVLSWPIIEDWLPKGMPGALNWEHTFFCPIPILKLLFAKFGFHLIEEQRFADDHSLFMAYARGKALTQPLKGDSATNRAIVADYFQSFERRVTGLRQRFEAQPEKTWLMPASVYSQYLYVFGLKDIELEGILDNSLSKQGLRLYGTRLSVCQPIDLPAQTRGTVVLNCGAHTAEIRHQLNCGNPNITVVDVNGF